mmetsp:Transcript_27072/g.26131  ORF Transcript_27072/g.26131 Transcript_27072/m.26131 type:complete len:97 (+) Transcript_27072:106-396(+)
MDRFTHHVEETATTLDEFRAREGKMAHGYPFTGWMQLGLLYYVGLYTAKEQGIVKRGVYFQKYWRAHYFDWLLFARRGAIYAWAGGLVLGTVLFGR